MARGGEANEKRKSKREKRGNSHYAIPLSLNSGMYASCTRAG
jgi:hypothetical protein